MEYPHKSAINAAIKEVADAYFVTPEQILSHKRARRFSRPRHIAMCVIRLRFGLSLKQIGRVFNCHHTTVLSALQYQAALRDVVDGFMRRR
jgi:chromosomal replication initiation ATPase DnaA